MISGIYYSDENWGAKVENKKLKSNLKSEVGGQRTEVRGQNFIPAFPNSQIPKFPN